MQDVQQAIDRSPATAPGPDGIPFVAWRRLGPVAAAVLHEAYGQLASAEGQEAISRHLPDYNESLMVFLPKGPSGVDGRGVPHYRPSDTRPLNLSNTDSRILASAVRSRIEPLLVEWVSPQQRGFYWWPFNAG